MKLEVLSTQTLKAELRRHFRQARRGYAGSEIKHALKDHIERWVRDFGQGAQICSYRPLVDEAEVELDPLTNYFFPRLRGDRLEFLKPRNCGDFAPGSFGILEPKSESGQVLDFSKPVIVLCPAVAVDTQGTRLGMGKGYYDRFFVSHPAAVRVAVAYHVQVSENPLPAESWDQPLDWIVTDKMILRTSKRSF